MKVRAIAAIFFVTATTFSTAPAQADNDTLMAWAFGTTTKDSIVAKDGLESVYKLVQHELASDRPNEESLALINLELQKRGLPQIKVESIVNMEIPKMVGITSSVGLGIDVSDGNYRFCLPCSTPNGWNSFNFGIVRSTSTEQF